MKNMKKQYGKEKGKEVFYASANKGTIKGVHGEDIDKFATPEEKEFLLEYGRVVEEDAYNEGYEEGYNTGYERGYSEGYAEGQMGGDL